MKWIQFDTNYFQCLNNSKINQTQLHQIRKWIEFDGSQQFNQFNQLKWIQFDANYSIVECNWLVSREGSGLLVFVLTFRLFWQSIELNRWQSADDAAAPLPPLPPLAVVTFTNYQSLTSCTDHVVDHITWSIGAGISFQFFFVHFHLFK